MATGNTRRLLSASDNVLVARRLSRARRSGDSVIWGSLMAPVWSRAAAGSAGGWQNRPTMTRRVLEIETLAAFDAHVRRARNLNGWFVQSLDLTERVEALLSLDPRGAVFLGCQFSPAVEAHLRRAGALIFPRLPDLPFDPYRAGLYDAVELYGSARSYRDSRDAAIYAWARSAKARSLAGALGTTLHDHAITDALDDATETIDPRRVVGIMGGHALLRTDPAYAAAARLAVHALRLRTPRADRWRPGGHGGGQPRRLSESLARCRCRRR